MDLELANPKVTHLKYENKHIIPYPQNYILNIFESYDVVFLFNCVSPKSIQKFADLLGCCSNSKKKVI